MLFRSGGSIEVVVFDADAREGEGSVFIYILDVGDPNDGGVVDFIDGDGDAIIECDGALAIASEALVVDGDAEGVAAAKIFVGAVGEVAQGFIYVGQRTLQGDLAAVIARAVYEGDELFPDRAVDEAAVEIVAGGIIGRCPRCLIELPVVVEVSL